MGAAYFVRREFPAFPLPALPAPLRAGLDAEAGAGFAPCLADSRGQSRRPGRRGRAGPSPAAAVGGCRRSGGGAAVPPGRRWSPPAALQSASAASWERCGLVSG